MSGADGAHIASDHEHERLIQSEDASRTAIAPAAEKYGRSFAKSEDVLGIYRNIMRSPPDKSFIHVKQAVSLRRRNSYNELRCPCSVNYL